jgi:hypothetical protein
LNDYPIDLCANLAPIAIEDRDQFKPFGRESAIMQKGTPQSSYPHQRHRPLAVKTKQVAYIVAASLLAESTEVTQVLSNLGGSDLQAGSQLIGTDYLSVFPFQDSQSTSIQG